MSVLKPSRYVALGNVRAGGGGGGGGGGDDDDVGDDDDDDDGVVQVVAPDELGNAEECSFVAEDTKAKVNLKQ